MSDPAGDGLAACLCRLLVAWTIELDNEFEQRMPHQTTLFGLGGPEPVLPSSGRRFRPPWLTSVAMWQNGLRFVPAGGVPAALLEGLGANLGGLQRWGYLRAVVQDDKLAAPVLKPTAAARYAQVVWSRLEGAIDERWEQRFGSDLVAALRTALLGVAAKDDEPAPLYLPVVTHADGMRTSCRDPSAAQLAAAGVASAAQAGLDTLLARALLRFTLDYETESNLSLPVTADVLAVLTDRAVPRRYLPVLGGVSKEGVQSAIGFLERRGLVVTGADPSAPAAGRGQAVSLTGRGRVAKDRYGRRWRAVEQRFADRFGAGPVDGLRAVLAALAEHRTGGEPTLALGLRPHENGWRARGRYHAQTRAMLADPWTALPRHPMVLHRGGFPDGS